MIELLLDGGKQIALNKLSIVIEEKQLKKINQTQLRRKQHLVAVGISNAIDVSKAYYHHETNTEVGTINMFVRDWLVNND